MSLYDEDYLKCWDKNCMTIFSIKSGIHSINAEKAEDWILGQTNDFRQSICRQFIEHTTYVPFKDVIQKVKNLVDQFYERLTEEERTKEIFLYTGDSTKSFYFLSVLFLYFAKKKKRTNPDIPLPTQFVKTPTPDFLKMILETKSPYIIIDDMSYSGSQLHNLLLSFWQFTNKTQKLSKFEGNLNHLNIYVLLIGATTVAENRLKQMDTRHNTPYTIICETIYPTLIETVGIEMFFYIRYFLSPFSRESPPISIYFDHKLADMTSTYLNTLVFGPIVPPDYNIVDLIRNTSKYEYLCDYISMDFNFVIKQLNTLPIHTSIELVDRFLKEIIRKHSAIELKEIFHKLSKTVGRVSETMSETSPEKKYYIHIDIPSIPELTNVYLHMQSIVKNMIQDYLCDSILEKDRNYPVDGKSVNKYIPFINTCETDHFLRKFIHSKSLQNIPYELFLIPSSNIDTSLCFHKKKYEQEIEISLTTFFLKYYKKTKQNPALNKKYLDEIHSFLESNRCPSSWYKIGSNRMCLLDKSKSKSKSRSKSKSLRKTQKSLRKIKSA